MEYILSANVRFIAVAGVNNARVANVAVSIFLIICNTTYSAFIAVIVVSLNAIIKQIANVTKIFCKLYSATNTFVTNTLSTIANRTHNFLYFKTIDFMRLVVIVTKTTRIHLFTTRRNQFASSKIVLAITIVIFILPFIILPFIMFACCHYFFKLFRLQLNI